MNGIDFGRAFKAPFDDPDWVKKTLLGLVWGILLVTSPALVGAMVEYIRSVAHGNERLPEWDAFGDKWVRGFMVLLAGILYFLPVWVLALAFFVPVVLASGSNNSDALAAAASGGLCLFGLLAIIYALAVGAVFYSAVVDYAITGEFGAFFRVGDNIARIRANPGYWTAWLIAILASFAASVVAGAIPVLGGLISFGLTYLAYMVGGNAFGQWAAVAYNGRGPMAPSAPGMYAPPAPPAYRPPPAPPAYPPVTPPGPPAE